MVFVIKPIGTMNLCGFFRSRLRMKRQCSAVNIRFEKAEPLINKKYEKVMIYHIQSGVFSTLENATF